MDELFFFVVVSASVIIIGAIWVKLRLDNTKQEKLIKKYLAELSLVKNEKQSVLITV